MTTRVQGKDSVASSSVNWGQSLRSAQLQREEAVLIIQYLGEDHGSSNQGS